MLELKLDHVGIGVEDLERGRAAYDRLGFRLAARSMHSGSPSAGAPIVPWGSGNHCAMLGTGYIEVLGLTDPTRYSSVKDMVARYEGLHIVALGCDDADATYQALSMAGVPVEAPRALERDAAFGPDDQAVRRARFRNIYLDRGRYPEARFLYIEHLTRDVLWQPHLLDHPNGAVALERVYFCGEDMATLGAKISGALAAQPRRLAPGHGVLALAQGSVHVFDAERWAAHCGTPPAGDSPMAVGFGVRVKSLAATRQLLLQRGVSIDERDGIWVDPAEGCGATLHFFEENDK